MTAAWFCAAHQVWTTGDCPRCNDELMALAEEDVPAAQERRAMSDYFLDVDGYGEPTIWQHDAGRPDSPQPMLRMCHLPPQGRHLWPRIVTALTEDPRCPPTSRLRTSRGEANGQRRDRAPVGNGQPSDQATPTAVYADHPDYREEWKP